MAFLDVDLGDLDHGDDLISDRVLAPPAIERKRVALGGSAGEPLIPGPEGLIEISSGFVRHFANGAIYFNRAIGEEAFYVSRAWQRYDQLGGPNSFLGWPISDDLPDPEEPGSGFNRFQNGAIFWWPDIGAIEMRPVSLRYVGLHCFGETDEFSASDEPYVIFGVAPVITEEQKTVRTRIYEGVDSGESRDDNHELYRGLPFGAVISITVSEHDQGDPERSHGLVEFGVQETSGKIVEGLQEVPAIGLFLSLVAKVVLFVAEPAITAFVHDVLGSEDDVLGTAVLALTPKEMMRLTRVAPQNIDGLTAHIASPLISGGGASYKAYFTIEAV
jgi:hypothetical protein